MSRFAKVTFSLFLAVFASAAAARPATAQTGAVKRGDINGDGAVNSVDALAVLTSVVGKPLPPQFLPSPYGDADGDNRLSAVDALIVLSHTVGMDVSAYPVANPVVGERPVQVSIAQDARPNVAMMYSLVDSTSASATRVRASAGTDSIGGLVVAANAAGDPILLARDQSPTMVLDAQSTALAATRVFFQPPFQVLSDSAYVDDALQAAPSFSALVAEIGAAARQGRSYLDSPTAVELIATVAIEAAVALRTLRAETPAMEVAADAAAINAPRLPIAIDDQGGSANYIVKNNGYIPFAVSSTVVSTGARLGEGMLRGRDGSWVRATIGATPVESIVLPGTDQEVRIDIFQNDASRGERYFQIGNDVLVFMFTAVGMKIDNHFHKFIYDLTVSVFPPDLLRTLAEQPREAILEWAIDRVIDHLGFISSETIDYLYHRFGVWGSATLVAKLGLKNLIAPLKALLAAKDFAQFADDRYRFYRDLVQYGSATDNVTICQVSGVFAECVARVDVTPASADVQTNGTVQLSGKVVGVSGADVTAQRGITWSSGDASLATVTGTGLVRAGTRAGQVRIYAASGGKRGEAGITINAPVAVASVTVNPAAATLTVGQSVTLTATPKSASGATLSGRTITWSTSDGSALTLSATSGGSISITAAAAHGAPVTVTATSEGKQGSSSITIQPVSVPVDRVAVSPSTATVKPGGTVALQASVMDAVGTPLTGRAVSWSSSNPGALSLAPVTGASTTATASASLTAPVTVTVTATSEGKSGHGTVEIRPDAVTSGTLVVRPTLNGETYTAVSGASYRAQLFSGSTLLQEVSASGTDFNFGTRPFASYRVDVYQGGILIGQQTTSFSSSSPNPILATLFPKRELRVTAYYSNGTTPLPAGYTVRVRDLSPATVASGTTNGSGQATLQVFPTHESNGNGYTVQVLTSGGSQVGSKASVQVDNSSTATTTTVTTSVTVPVVTGGTLVVRPTLNGSTYTATSGASYAAQLWSGSTQQQQVSASGTSFNFGTRPFGSYRVDVYQGGILIGKQTISFSASSPNPVPLALFPKRDLRVTAYHSNGSTPLPAGYTVRIRDLTQSPATVASGTTNGSGQATLQVFPTHESNGNGYTVQVLTSGGSQVGSKASVQVDNSSTATTTTVTTSVTVPVATGSISSTLRNINGSSAATSGTRHLLYTGPTRTVAGSNPASFTNVPAGSYLLEGYFSGTFFGEEFWTSQSNVTVVAGQTVNVTLTRNYPYASVVIKNDATGAVLAAGQSVPTGTRLRAEVTVRNNVPGTSLSSRVRFIFDRSKTTPYDFDQTASSQTVSGSGGTRLYTFIFTPTSAGQYHYALAVTTAVTGSYILTDSWTWTQTITRQ